MTPLEFRREMAAFEERRRDEAEHIIAIAWYSVAIENEMHAAKRLKSLSQTIEQFAPRQVVADKPKPASAQSIAATLGRLGYKPKPMSDETLAAMWKPREPVHG